MGLSRRQFTKEFKLAAVRRLEQGVSIAEAARALEVSANVLDGHGTPPSSNRDWSITPTTVRSMPVTNIRIC
jgi:transposase-like protein